MKINDNRSQKTQSFQSIHRIGIVFEYENEIFMTISNVENSENYYNAVCLHDGELGYFIDEQVLVLDNVTLEIY